MRPWESKLQVGRLRCESLQWWCFNRHLPIQLKPKFIFCLSKQEKILEVQLLSDLGCQTNCTFCLNRLFCINMFEWMWDFWATFDFSFVLLKKIEFKKNFSGFCIYRWFSMALQMFDICHCNLETTKSFEYLFIFSLQTILIWFRELIQF